MSGLFASALLMLALGLHDVVMRVVSIGYVGRGCSAVVCAEHISWRGGAHSMSGRGVAVTHAYFCAAHVACTWRARGVHVACTWRATWYGTVRAGSGFPVGHSTGGCLCAYARFISGGLRLLAGAGFCPPESEPHQSGWDWLCGLYLLSQQGDSCAGLRQILGAALPAARVRRCSPGPGRLQLHVVRRRGQAVAVLLMSVLGRSGRRKESGLRPWLAAEPRVVATRSCRCCSGNRRRVHSRPA